MRTAAFLLLAWALACSPARAIPPEVLQSVVSVIPDWPAAQEAPPEVRRAMRERPEGSGVAILPGGYVATNLHVVRGARAVRVRLDDGRFLAAEVVGTDPATDLALLKLPVDLPPLPPGPVPALAAPVCAVGNAFGLGLSVTCGVVSAVQRSGTGFNAVEDFVQTDAAVNPGGSGGALVDAEGRLVGIVSAIFTKEVDANIGVNFAASAALALRVSEDLKAGGRVVRATLGVAAEDLPEDRREAGDGARLAAVEPLGPADAAGLKVGDVVIEAGGRRIRSASDLTAAVYLRRAGDTLALRYRRGDASAAADARLAPARP